MGRAIQRLEDLHHGFAMDRFGALLPKSASKS